MNLAKLGKGDAGHGLQNQFLLIGKLLQIILDNLMIFVRVHSGLGNPLIQELLLDVRSGLQGFCHQILKVNNLYAMIS